MCEHRQFDLLGVMIRGELEGLRLEGGRYQPVRPVRARGWHRTEAMGLELRADGWLLRFHDPLEGRDLLTHSEASKALGIPVRAGDRAVQERDRAVCTEEERRAEAEATERLRVERELDQANQWIRELEALLRLSDNAG